MKWFLFWIVFLFTLIGSGESPASPLRKEPNISEYASLNSAVATLGSITPVTLVVSSETELTSNLVVPANISLRMLNSGRINQGKYSLTINGPIDAGLYEVFTGSGAVIFGPGSIDSIFPQWFGGGPKSLPVVNGTALNKCAATKVPIQLTSGTWNFSGNISIQDVPVIRGVPGRTILKPSHTVTGVFLAISNTIRNETSQNYPIVLDGLDIDGTATTGATGIKIGTSGITDLVYVRNVEVYGFRIGVHVADVVNFKADECTFARNGTNVLVEGSPKSSLPTRVTFSKTNFVHGLITRGAGVGLDISTGEVESNDCLFENNAKEGIRGIAKAPIKLILNNPYFEANQSSELMPSNFYHILMNGKIGSIDFRIFDPTMSLTAGAPKAISLNRIDNFDIRGIYSSAGMQASILKFSNSCYGKLSMRKVSGPPSYYVLSDGSNKIE